MSQALVSSKTMATAGLPGDDGHEQVQLHSDVGNGLSAIIAIHNTTRGPAFGGCRVRRYADQADALSDALRLSQAMSAAQSEAASAARGPRDLEAQRGTTGQQGALCQLPRRPRQGLRCRGVLGHLAVSRRDV